MNVIDIIGAIGSTLFGVACAPMAWETVKLGRGIGTPKWTIWIFVVATILFGVYLTDKVGLWQVPTLVVFFEAACWLIAAWYEYFPRYDEITDSVWADLFGDRDMPTIGYCTRPHHEESPCNGFPRRDCPMTDISRERFYPKSGRYPDMD